VATLSDREWLEFNEGVIAEFRANDGRCGGRFEGNPMVLLTTTGARTGLARTSPITYTTDGDRIVLIASKAGGPSHPAWYHNLVADPEVTVEVGTERWRGRASVAAEPERSRLYAERVAVMPRFAGYREATTREIPVVVIERLGEGPGEGPGEG
jgi:deazaflavin-dependent oxidoreductase (nitroreductase family)